MKRSPQIKILPLFLRRIRENFGYTKEELAKKLNVSSEKIEKVERGEEYFTLTQIKKLADVYKVPLAIFFSNRIPDIPILPDYRINRQKRLRPEVFAAIRRAKFLSEEIKELSGIKSKIPTYSEKAPDEIARRFRNEYGIEVKRFDNPSKILEFYKDIIEGVLNVLVLELPLKADDVRAFSIFSDLSVVVLNESDEPQIKLFSLFHELAHLLKRGDGICSIDVELESLDIERFCDRFAAEFLIPKDILLSEVKKEDLLTDEKVRKFAKMFGVSVQVMMLRFLELGLISKERYLKFKNEFDKTKIKKVGIRNWEKTYRNRSGKLSINEVIKAYRSGEISFYEAMRILDLKPKYAEKIIE